MLHSSILFSIKHRCCEAKFPVHFINSSKNLGYERAGTSAATKHQSRTPTEYFPQSQLLQLICASMALAERRSSRNFTFVDIRFGSLPTVYINTSPSSALGRLPDALVQGFRRPTAKCQLLSGAVIQKARNRLIFGSAIGQQPSLAVLAI